MQAGCTCGFPCHGSREVSGSKLAIAVGELRLCELINALLDGITQFDHD